MPLPPRTARVLIGLLAVCTAWLLVGWARADSPSTGPATSPSDSQPGVPRVVPGETEPEPADAQPPDAGPIRPARAAIDERLIGIHIDEVPFEPLDRLAPIEAAVGPIDIVHWYQAWGGGNHAFRHEWFNAVSESDRIGLISWEPWALSGQASQPEYAPAAILSGAHDDYIRSWADGFLSRDDGPWYLRPMHEMNGDWYPWSGGVAGGDPLDYLAAWRHIHDIFSEAGVRNVSWVWCPLVDDISGEFEEYYPGPDVVDVLCLDGYNWGSSDPAYGGWREPQEVFDQAYDRIAALGEQPIWLAEVGSATEGGDKAAWTAELLSTDRYPRVSAMVFFSLDKERDWRIHTDPEVAEAVRTNR